MTENKTTLKEGRNFLGHRGRRGYCETVRIFKVKV